MRTNKLKIKFNMENIDADFDIFQVTKEDTNDYKVNLLDSAVYEFKAAAVQYSFGKSALVLFYKNSVTEHDFKESIMKEYKDAKVKKIDLFNPEECKKCFYTENRLLAQLLFNSMRAPLNEKFRYNNLTGKLFYNDPSWKIKDKNTGKIRYFRFLEVVLDPGMFLNLEHKTFKRCDYDNGKRMYVIDPKTGEFRKRLQTDKIADMYIEKARAHKRFNVQEFNISSYAGFRKCKMGVMEQFLRDVKSKLGKYMSIEMTEREDTKVFDVEKWEKSGLNEKEYGNLLKRRGVVIVDENLSEKSMEIVEGLKYELKKYYYVDAEVGGLCSNAYNIRIIHNSEYYLENELFDLHADNMKGYIVQHMTEETEYSVNEKSSSPIIRKIVQELIIKGDVRDRLISIYDWKRFASGKEWNFIIRRKMGECTDDKNEHINFAGAKSYKYYTYYRLTIDQNGLLTFDTYQDISAIVNAEWEKICFAYDEMEKKHFGARNTIDGLLYSDIDNIHAIVLTKEKTLPNTSVLLDTLKETDENIRVPKEDLLKGIITFKEEYLEYREYTEVLLDKLKDAKEILTKKEVKQLLNLKTDAASCLNRYLHENYNLWIDGELRKEEFDAFYQISNLLNIKFQYDDFDYIDGRSFVYYVGAKSKKRTYPNSCCMRKVVAMGEELEYEEVLPLMVVEFVRNSQYTVLPFPYKYLREYIAQVD